MKQYHHPAREAITLSGALHALSDPVRLDIVRCLAAGSCERMCSSFEAPLSKSTMSHHLRILREAGLIQMRSHGTQSLISLRRDDLEARFPGVLEAILRVEEPSSLSGKSPPSGGQ